VVSETILDTLPSILNRSVQQHGANTALSDGFGHVDYETLDRWSNKAANALGELGVGKGDRVALVMGNCREFVFLWFGLAKIGAVHVAINARLKGDALLYQIRHCDPCCLVIDEEVLHSLEIEEREQLPKIPTLVRGSGSAEMSLGSVLENASDAEPKTQGVVASDALVIMYTSGTTGSPKGVVIPHFAYARAAQDLARVMALTERDCMYVCLPLYHGNPQVMGVMPTLTVGGQIALSTRFSASRFWEEVAAYRATTFTHIGSILGILLKQPPVEDEEINTLRLALGGASKPMVEEFSRRFSCEMLDGWGMIEVGCNTTVTPRVGVPPTGQHGFPRDCFEIRVVSQDDRPQPPGSVGEILVRPTMPNVMFQGYFNDPDRTLGKMKNLWFHTGDRGRMWDDGSLEFLGRDEDAVRRNGENISVEMIEGEIALIDGVSEVAVVGVPAELVGQELVACVVRDPNSSLSALDIARWTNDRLGHSLSPRYVRFMPSFPKTASEKVQRFKLRELGLEGALDCHATT